MLELVLLDGTERRFVLEEGRELTVGAANACDVRLASADVSRKHALLSCQRGKVMVLDLGSTNGTFVNGRRVKESMLAPGDAVRFSSVVAQVLPPAGPRSPSGGFRLPSPAPEDHTSSERMPVILQDSLNALLARWALGDGAAVATLADWLVSHRGTRGAAVLEAVQEDLAVRAASGDVEDVLHDKRARDLAGVPGQEPGTIESIRLDTGDRRVLAVRCAGGPWLVLSPRDAMPEATEIELYVRLLAVAGRLDACAASAKPAKRKR